MVWFLANFGLHILFTFYELGEPFGPANPEKAVMRRGDEAYTGTGNLSITTCCTH